MTMTTLLVLKHFTDNFQEVLNVVTGVALFTVLSVIAKSRGGGLTTSASSHPVNRGRSNPMPRRQWRCRPPLAIPSCLDLLYSRRGADTRPSLLSPSELAPAPLLAGGFEHGRPAAILAARGDEDASSPRL